MDAEIIGRAKMKASDITEFKRDEAKELKCPRCGSNMLFLYGGGFDYDRALCSNRKCDYEKEYESSTNGDERC